LETKTVRFIVFLFKNYGKANSRDITIEIKISGLYLDEREADIGDPAVHDFGHTGSLHAAQALPQVLRTRVTVAVPLSVLPAHTYRYYCTVCLVR
jgi:hypothetical protein